MFLVSRTKRTTLISGNGKDKIYKKGREDPTMAENLIERRVSLAISEEDVIEGGVGLTKWVTVDK